MAGKTGKNYYSVARGRTTGIFTDWRLCEQSIHKYPHACFKGFNNLNEAIHFLSVVYTFTCNDINIYTGKELTPRNPSELGHICTSECGSVDFPTGNDQQVREITPTDSEENTNKKTLMLDSDDSTVQRDRDIPVCSFCRTGNDDKADSTSVQTVRRGATINAHSCQTTSYIS